VGVLLLAFSDGGSYLVFAFIFVQFIQTFRSLRNLSRQFMKKSAMFSTGLLVEMEVQEYLDTLHGRNECGCGER